jgi:hypothetical protein
VEGQILKFSCTQLTIRFWDFVSDEYFTIDFVDPRRNRGFMFNVLGGVTSPLCTRLNNILRIEWHIVDMQDLPMYSLSIVNSGTALLFERPTFPKVWKESFKKLHKKYEKTPCDITIANQAVMVNKATKEEWLTTKVLIMLPPDQYVSVDFDGEGCNLEGKVLVNGVQTRQYPFTGNLCFLDYKLEIAYRDQKLQACWWQVRLAHVETKVLVADRTSNLAEAFSGMATI